MKDKTVVRGEEEMRTERHYDTEYLSYLANARDEWVKLYKVYSYERDDVRHQWFFSSLKSAKKIIPELKKTRGMIDIYIKELQCYVDDVGLIWVEHVHYITDD
jgi:hypothetical protein